MRLIAFSDDNTGLYYLMARFYDPEVGRFLSQDPLSDVPDYKYGANSPLNYVDPDGLQERDMGLCCAGSANIGPYVRTVQNAAAVVGGTIDSANQQSMADSVEPTNRRNYGEIIKRNYQLGVEGEREAGISGVKEQIGSASKKRNYRIPDSIDHKMGTLTEVKNVKKQYLSTQLRDFLSWSEQRNYEFRLVVRQDTKLTGPLKELVDVGRITLIRRLGK